MMSRATTCLLLAALALISTTVDAQRSSCPATVCNAYFANAQGGPIDCCNWDYNKGTCKWGGTPVSWKLVRNCQDAAKNYAVLVSSNSQGPPGTSECRCNNAQGPQFSVLQACMSLKPRMDSDIDGQDIPCKSNSFCQVCGSVDDVKNACVQDNRCVAFSYESSTSCGYLKTAPFYKQRTGWVAYTRD